MNILSKNICMNDTNFTNPHGLPNNNNYSTPYDLAILVSKCMQF